MISLAHTKQLILATLCISLLFVATATQAQTRFTLSEIDNGYILLNQETGTLSICEKDGAELICNAASKPQKPAGDKKASGKNEVKNIDYYFNRLFSAGFQKNSSDFFAELTKRLFDMTDAIKEPFKAAGT